MKLLRDTNVGVDQALTDPNKGDYSKAHTTAIYVSLFMYIPISEPDKKLSTLGQDQSSLYFP